MSVAALGIEIDEHAFAAKACIEAMQRGDIDPALAPQEEYGQWKDIVATVYENYKSIYDMQGQQEAIHVVESTINIIKQNDPSFCFLMEDVVAYQEKKEEEAESIITMPALPEAIRYDESEAAHVRREINQWIEWSSYWSPRGHALFHESSFLFLLAALSARRIVLPILDGKYTPLYVLFSAKTSTYAKSTTARLVLAALDHLGLDWMLLPNNSTPEAYYDMASKNMPSEYDSMNDYERERIEYGKRFASQRSMFHGEFGSLLAQISQSKSAMKDWQYIHLQMDDGVKRLGKNTITRGSEELENPFLSMLMIMTPENVSDTKGGTNLWNDGTFARYAIMAPPRGKYSKAPMPMGDLTYPAPLMKSIRQFFDRLGLPEMTVVERETKNHGKKYVCQHGPFPRNVCTLDPGVWEQYIAYSDAMIDLINLEDTVHGDLHGSYTRLPEKAMRIAALLAWLNNGGAISREHWIAAQCIAERWRQSIHNFHDQATNSQTSYHRELEKTIEKHVTKAAKYGGLRANQVQQRIRGVSAKTIHETLENMCVIGTLEKHIIPGGKSKTLRITVYNLPGEKAPKDAIVEEEKPMKQGKS